MMITVRTMILMDGRFEGRRDSDDGDDNFVKTVTLILVFIFSDKGEPVLKMAARPLGSTRLLFIIIILSL